MKFAIKHEIKGRLRIHVVRSRMTYAEADTLCWFLEKQEGITNVKVYERTADAAICYTGDREKLIWILRRFRFETAEIPEQVLASSGRTLNDSSQSGQKTLAWMESSKIHRKRNWVSGQRKDRGAGSGCYSY